MSMVGAAATIAGYSVMKKTLGELQDLATGELKKKLKKLANERRQEEISKKIRKIGLVKTLLDGRFEVDLNTIYHPTMVECKKSRVRASGIDKLPNYNGLLIEGTVGQGKSTFMRFLVCSMAQFNKEIPIFLEFRNIKSNELLVDALKRQLDVYGLECDDEVFDFYCSSGKFVFFLDGFDELKMDDVQGVVIEIGDLRHKYNDSLKIVVSSRPQNELSDHPLFKLVKVLPIAGEDRLEFLQRIDSDKDRSERLGIALQNTTSEIVDVLDTPLMLTLLCKIHSAYNQIPETFIEFYEKLFMAMYRDHDDRKPGFNRQIKSGLNPNQVEEVFSLFSFLCSVDEMFSFNDSEYYQKMSMSVEKIGCTANVSGLMKDIVDISCMVVKEGNEYKFIHKSICEYYAAKYIVQKNEGFKEAFYGNMLNEFDIWSQQLNYLREIDRVAFHKYFYIPNLTRNKIYRDELMNKGMSEVIKERLKKCVFGYSQDGMLRSSQVKKQHHFTHCFNQEVDLLWQTIYQFHSFIPSFFPDYTVFKVISANDIDLMYDFENEEVSYIDGANFVDDDQFIKCVSDKVEGVINYFDDEWKKAELIVNVEKIQNDMLEVLFE